MLLSKEQKLDTVVVTALSELPFSTAKELQSFIEKKSRGYTIQAVYKELRKLERNGIVVKKHGNYSLRFLWITELKNFSDATYGNYLKSHALENELPTLGKSAKWTFGNLRQLLDLWTDMSFLLLRRMPAAERIIFECVEHIWFHTANPINEEHFIKATLSDKIQYYLVCPNNTYLDKTYEPILKKLKARYSLGRLGYPSKDQQYMTVVGDFVIDVSLSKLLNNKIQTFYRKVRAAKDLRPQDLVAFSNLRGRCSLKITQDPIRASRERQKFELFFSKKT